MNKLLQDTKNFILKERIRLRIAKIRAKIEKRKNRCCRKLDNDTFEFCPEEEDVDRGRILGLREALKLLGE